MADEQFLIFGGMEKENAPECENSAESGKDLGLAKMPPVSVAPDSGAMSPAGEKERIDAESENAGDRGDDGVSSETGLNAEEVVSGKKSDSPGWRFEGSLRGKRVFVIDAYGLIYQVFHALPPMFGQGGEMVNAVFGFVRDLFLILEHQKPDLLFCAFDLHAPTFRSKMFSEYKATREKMPEELIGQIPRVREILEELRVPVLSLEGFEADDILATAAQRTTELGGECVLVTSDKDSRQLISEQVSIFSLRRNIYLDRAFLESDWGILPEQVVDYQALVGDSSDNVPGIALIGPKMAKELLARFGTLEEILKPENLELFFGPKPTKKKENLLNGRETALLCQALVRLDRNVPIDIDWECGDTSRFDFHAVRPLFEQYGFRTLLQKAELLGRLSDAESDSSQWFFGSGTQNQKEKELVELPSVFEDSVQSRAELPFFEGRFELKEGKFPSDEQILILPPALFKEETFLKKSVVSEIRSAGQMDLFGVFSEDEESCGIGEEQGGVGEFLKRNRAKLESSEIIKIGFDMKRLENRLRQLGAVLRGPRFDVMLAAYIFQPDGSHGSLKELVEAFPEAFMAKEVMEAVREAEAEIAREKKDWESQFAGSEKGKRGKKEKEPVWLEAVDFENVQRLFLRELFVILTEKLRKEHLDSVCFGLEFPLTEVLAEMERWGIYVRKERLREISEQFRNRIEKLRDELYALIGLGEETSKGETELNLNSPKQLQKVLFETLNLPVLHRTKTGPSTDAQTLEELAAQHPFPAKLLEYRQMMKLQSTYVEALPKLIGEDGRIHTSFNQAVTATGRLSSSDPNLQNIPVRTAEGKMIRSAFVPEKPDWMFVSADYSQIELRVLAHYCGDRNLQEAFQNGEDIHTRVAGQIYGVPLEQVTSSMRRVAKTVNFGIIYGQSAFGLAAQLKIPHDEARTFIQTYFTQFPSIELLLDAILDYALVHGSISTLFGRRRLIQGIRKTRKGQLNQAERTAVNTVIQGSAADLIKLAMLRVSERLRREELSARLLLQIHDELLLECPREEAELVGRVLQEEMTSAWKLSVPLKVDLSVGNAWE